MDEEIGRAEAQEAAAAPRPEETRGSGEKPVTLQQPGRARDSWDSGSNVEDMRNRLKTLGPPVWGTKAQMALTRPCRGKARAPETR